MFRHLLIARWPRRSGMRAEIQHIANSIVDRFPDVRRSAWAEEHFFGRALYRLPRGTLTPTDYCVDITKRRIASISMDIAAIQDPGAGDVAMPTPFRLWKYITTWRRSASTWTFGEAMCDVLISTARTVDVTGSHRYHGERQDMKTGTNGNSRWTGGAVTSQ